MVAEPEHLLDLLLSRCAEPLRLIDVGARFGVGDRWSCLGDRARVLGFDPDPIECARLNDWSPPHIRYVPIGLADHEGEQLLHLTSEPACSSVYRPLESVSHWDALACIRPTGTMTMSVRRLDNVVKDNDFTGACLLKIDTQGSELDILKGSKETLRSCALVEVEVEFNRLYEGQPLFWEVDQFMRQQGFVLWRFENLVHYSPERLDNSRPPFFLAGDPGATNLTWSPHGQLFWAQALYVPEKLTPAVPVNVEPSTARVGAVVAGLYGLWDLSIELTRRAGDQDIVEKLWAILNAE